MFEMAFEQLATISVVPYDGLMEEGLWIKVGQQLLWLEATNSALSGLLVGPGQSSLLGSEDSIWASRLLVCMPNRPKRTESLVDSS